MKFSIHQEIYQTNPLELEKPYRNLFRKMEHQFVDAVKTFWRFSRYYGRFITHTTQKTK
jgi:hypothetical protein